MRRQLSRRRFLTRLGLATSVPLLAACDRLGASPAFRGFLSLGERLSYRVHRLIGSSALATEYPESELSPVFRTNGNTRPASSEYQRHAAEGFAGWRLAIDGLVDAPQSLSLAALRDLEIQRVFLRSRALRSNPRRAEIQLQKIGSSSVSPKR